MQRKLRSLNMEPEQVARRAARQKNKGNEIKRKQRRHGRRLLVAVLQSMQSIRNLLGVLKSIEQKHEGSARVVGGAATSARANRPQGFTNAVLMVWQRGILRHR